MGLETDSNEKVLNGRKLDKEFMNECNDNNMRATCKMQLWGVLKITFEIKIVFRRRPAKMSRIQVAKSFSPDSSS